MKRQRKTKNTEEIIRQTAAYDRILELLNNEGHTLTSGHRYRLKELMDKSGYGVDIGYIKTVVFPEDNFFDIPQPLSTISFSRFSHKDEAIVHTGPAGQGILTWFPRTVSGPCLFITYPTSAATNVKMQFPLTSMSQLPAANTSLSDPANTQAEFRGGFSYDYQDYFQSAVLVGASLSLQYIGTMDNESGLMVGGQLFDMPWSQIDSSSIENATWFTKARPSEGLRFVHLPVDQQDFQYYPISAHDIEGSNKKKSYIKSMNQGGEPINNAEPMYAIGAYNTFDRIIPTTVPGGTGAPIPTNVQATDKSATSKVYMYAQSSNCIAIYWTGLKPNEDWFRIDMMRRFNGTPYSKFRDIVDITKPVKSFDSKKSIDAVCQLSLNSPIGGQTLREMDKLVDQLQELLPNIGYLQENGGIQRVNTLQQLASQLDISNSQEKQMQGFLQGSGMRLYPY